MPTKTEAIKAFLIDFTHKDLANLYNYSMEVQVNVAQGSGEKVKGEYKGRMWHGYSSNSETWKAIRIPWGAATNPNFIDSRQTYNLETHVEAIGMTGWDWEHKVSKWVAFDFDGISGHAESHVARLTEQELVEVKNQACNIPWVTVRKSSGGQGLHLYVFLNNVPTITHTEHAALGRAILGLMSAETGFDFSIKVDACGGNMWIYHRKMVGVKGLELITRGGILTDIPINWRDHLTVVAKQRRRSIPKQVSKTNQSLFEQTTGQRKRAKLDDGHKRLLTYLKESKASWWWDADRWMLVCHTFDLELAHKELGLRGIFETTAVGKRHGEDWNCFCFPMTDPPGAWSVRRFSEGVAEKPNWEQDGAGWTFCYLNRAPSIRVAARVHGGVEDEKGAFHFIEAEVATTATNFLGAHLDLPPWCGNRRTIIKQHKDGRLVVHVQRLEQDDVSKMVGWREEKGWWKKIFTVKLAKSEDISSIDFDTVIRHLSTNDGTDYGWVVKIGEKWNTEPLQHIKVALKARDLVDSEINKALGQCVLDPWKLVNEPFQDEYPGGRCWNRESAQFRYQPQLEEPFEHPTWDLILKHCGCGFDSSVANDGWCQANGLSTGEDYLRIWISSLLQYPKRPLPYLFLYSKTENTGKSTLHEALSFLINPAGYARADNALISSSGFNGELVGAVLCVIQETDISKSVGARNRLKDWVTALQMPIHVKNKTPYLIDNTTHYIHTANDPKECPIFPGDTRIVVIEVPPLDPLNMVPRDELHVRLKKEGPAIMATFLGLELPKSPDRLNVPVVTTDEKIQHAKLNRNDFEVFMEETLYFAPGEMISYREIFTRFLAWLPTEDQHLWSIIKMGRELPKQYPKGRVASKAAKFYIGNISLTPPIDVNQAKLILEDDFLIKEDL